jgi:hypothetical protein
VRRVCGINWLGFVFWVQMSDQVGSLFVVVSSLWKEHKFQL